MFNIFKQEELNIAKNLYEVLKSSKKTVLRKIEELIVSEEKVLNEIDAQKKLRTSYNKKSLSW